MVIDTGHLLHTAVERTDRAHGITVFNLQGENEKEEDQGGEFHTSHSKTDVGRRVAKGCSESWQMVYRYTVLRGSSLAEVYISPMKINFGDKQKYYQGGSATVC